MNKIKTAALALLGAVAAIPALAADLPRRTAAVAPPAAIAYAQSPWMIRVRGLAVLPQSSATVFAAGALVPGGNLNASNAFVPELDITYFFTKNFAAELILGVSPHNVKGTGALAALGKIGSTLLLPPTLTLQYHFTELGAFKPYVGAGVNYTFMLNNQAAGPFTTFRVNNTGGFALQAGFDYMIDKNWGFNVDVKKLFLRPSASGTLGLVPVTANVRLDPWIVGLGVTYRF